MKPRCIFIGDAVVSSGFAKNTHALLDTLCKTWDVYVIGLNYSGDPLLVRAQDGWEARYPYPIYPADPTNTDFFGLSRMVELAGVIGPQLMIIQNDPWNFPKYMRYVGNVPTLGIVAVDGKNCRGEGLNGLAHAVFWTKFGLEEARLGGYTGPASVVPLGVDLDIYKPFDQKYAREWLKLPPRAVDGFIVGVVNRNQTRKRFDLLMEYFAEWVKSRRINDAFLYLHVAPTGEDAFDIGQGMKYYGVADRLIYCEPTIGYGLPESRMPIVYSAFDVQATTTQGEGWGLPTIEGMACGVPQIFPDWAALGDWAVEAGMAIPCSATAMTPNQINVVGGIADKEQFIAALDLCYNDPATRSKYRGLGFELISRAKYRWETIGVQFAGIVDQVAYTVKGVTTGGSEG